MTAQDWLGIVMLLVVLSSLLGALRLYQVGANPAPEFVRKLFHLAGGLFGWAVGVPDRHMRRET